VEQSWIGELEKVWIDLGVPEFLSQIGVDFQEAFIAPLRACSFTVNPYREHGWTFFRLDRLPPGVLHAYPLDKVGSSPALWEEWFIEAGVNHHHSMNNSPAKPDELDGSKEYLQWRSPHGDDEHPETVMDIDWHYFNDADQRPFLLR